MALLSALNSDSDVLELLELDVVSMARLSECSRAALQIASSARLWSRALKQLKQQHLRAGTFSPEQCEQLSPRVRLGMGMRRAGRDVARLHRFFGFECDQAPAFDMEAAPDQEDKFGLREQGNAILNLRMRNRPRYNLMNDIILLHMAMDDMMGAHGRDEDDACYSFGRLLDASDAQVQAVADSNRSEVDLYSIYTVTSAGNRRTRCSPVRASAPLRVLWLTRAGTNL